MLLRYVIIFTLFTGLITACSQSPTGRNQFKLYSSQSMQQMGSQAFLQMKDQTPATANKIYNKEVACIAEAMLPHVPSSIYNGRWEYVVFDDKQVNAFALPGGKIGVYTGLIELAETSAQLAAVIGHEIGHVIADHSNERLSSDTVIAQGMQVADKLLTNNKVSYSEGVMAGLGLGLQMGVKLPFSRTHETEADIIGLNLMAKAGFDPRDAIRLWQLMDRNSQGQRQPEFLSTHPSPQSRITKMQQHMNKAMVLYRNAKQRPRCS